MAKNKKAFIFSYQTNYDLGAAIIYADSKEDAIKIAEKSSYIWDTNNCYEVNFDKKSDQIVIIREDNFQIEKIKGDGN